MTDDIQLFARVENLLDEDYEDVLGFNTAGTSGYLGVRVGFWPTRKPRGKGILGGGVEPAMKPPEKEPG